MTGRYHVAAKEMPHMLREIKMECGYEFNMLTGSNRSFMTRFKLHCKICKYCNENMKNKNYKDMIEYRLSCNDISTNQWVSAI